MLIDVRTGQYTPGTPWLEARAEFDTRIGREIAGYVHRVRDRTFEFGATPRPRPRTSSPHMRIALTGMR